MVFKLSIVESLGKFRPRPATVVQTVAALVASLAYLAIGLVRAWAATGLPSLNSTWGDALDPETASWVVSLPPLGAMLGSLLSSCTLAYSRRASIFLSGLLFLAAFSLMGVAHLASFLPLVLAGRLLSGMGVGIAVPSSAIYIAEISSPDLRGKLSSLPATFQALGVLLSYAIGLALDWHQLAWTCTAPALLLICSLFFLPESPSHLARKGEKAAAAAALKWLRADVHTEQQQRVEGEQVSGCQLTRKEDEERSCSTRNAKEKEEEGKSKTSTFTQITMWATVRPLLITCFLHFVQNWCGVNVIVFKTVSVFESLGTSLDSGTCTLAVGGTQLVATAGSILLVDAAGRKPLLIASCSITALAMGSLATFLQLGDLVPHSLAWIPLVSIIASFLGYSLGLATLPYVLMGELLPASTRSITSAISSTFNLVCLFLILKFYTSISLAVNLSGVYWLFTGVSLSGALFVAICLPETRGRSLQEIEDAFKST